MADKYRLSEKYIPDYRIKNKDLERMYKHWEKDTRQGGQTKSVEDYYAMQLYSGNVPDFYANGGGFFGDEFGGYMPGKVDKDLVPFFGGQLMRAVGDGYEGYFSPLDNEYNDLLNAARRAKTVDKVAKDFRSAGSSYGLHPFKRKKSTPFTIDKGRLSTFLEGGEGDKGGDVGNWI